MRWSPRDTLSFTPSTGWPAGGRRGWQRALGRGRPSLAACDARAAESWTVAPPAPASPLRTRRRRVVGVRGRGRSDAVGNGGGEATTGTPLARRSALRMRAQRRGAKVDDDEDDEEERAGESDEGSVSSGSLGAMDEVGAGAADVLGWDLARASAAFSRLGTAAWWMQFLLSIVSGGITLFAVAILNGSRAASGTTSPAASTGLLFAGLGLICAFASVFWTYGYTRLGRRMQRARKTGYGIKAENVLRTLRVGATINLAGMALTLLGAQSITGVLLAKALSQGVAGPVPFYAAGTVQAGGGSLGYVQALDIFVVQANSNSLMSHFVGLCTSLWLLWRFRSFQTGSSKR